MGTCLRLWSFLYICEFANVLGAILSDKSFGQNSSMQMQYFAPIITMVFIISEKEGTSGNIWINHKIEHDTNPVSVLVTGIPISPTWSHSVFKMLCPLR